MKKGFTIIELLVASMLLGLLATILTMVFNQSSIAWRTGTALVADLDVVRDTMGELRDEADNAFAWGGRAYRITGLWDEDGKLYDRACNAPGSRVASSSSARTGTPLLDRYSGVFSASATRPLYSTQNQISTGNPGGAKSVDSYTVNVKSAGPDKTFDTYDDIWSWPDDFD